MGVHISMSQSEAEVLSSAGGGEFSLLAALPCYSSDWFYSHIVHKNH